jgi:serine/threonine protein kinase
MLAPTKNCLTRDEIQRFLLGNLPADEFESASEHLDQCQDCQSSIEQINAYPAQAEPAASSWLGDAQPDPQHAEIACQFALHRLLMTPPSGLEKQHESKPRASVELGPYRILSDLGRGGMGTVCLAEHQRLKRRCAIKLLPPARVTQPGWLERFEREMAAVASLEHPGIVRANDAGCHDGWHYLVMEYLDGLDVGRVVDRLDTLPVADACEIVRQAALAIAHVHNAGLVHRDIKPSNLMLTHSGTIKLLDLGLVLAGDDPLASDDRLTTVGHLMGTLPAMSPEQLIDSRRVSASSDIYSLGASLYRLIAGQWPFDSSGGIATRILRMTSEVAPSIRMLRPETDPKLVSLIDQMLDRDPKQRPTAEEVASRIAQWTCEADLTSLLNRAERASDPASTASDPPRPSFANFAAVQASRGNVPPASPPRRWHVGFYAAGFLAAAALVAIITIKIRTDKGEVLIETDGNDVQVAIAPDGQNANQTLPPSDEKPIPVERLYQGKNLDHWLETLEREQEIETVGQAMKAIELLSRDTDRRQEAAEKTLAPAKEYGSILYDDVKQGVGGLSFAEASPDPSRRYMGHLRLVFPGYFPQPALDVIENELASGNAKSKIAAVVLLDEYISGVYDSTEYPERRATAHATIKGLAAFDSDVSPQARRLVGRLGSAIESFENSRDPLSTSMTLATWDLASKIVEASDGRLRGGAAWMSEYVIKETERSIAEYQAWVQQQAADANKPAADSTPRENDDGFYVSPGVAYPVVPTWVLPAPIFAEAMMLQRTDKLSMPVDFAIAVIMHPQFAWYPDEEMAKTFERVSRMSPDAEQMLVVAIEKLLDEFDALNKSADQEAKTQSPWSLNDKNRMARQQVSAPFGVWVTAIPFYARHAADIEQATARIERTIRWLNNGINRHDMSRLLEAKKILASRVEQSQPDA